VGPLYSHIAKLTYATKIRNNSLRAAVSEALDKNKKYSPRFSLIFYMSVSIMETGCWHDVYLQLFLNKD
jgi:hypothetical protein